MLRAYSFARLAAAMMLLAVASCAPPRATPPAAAPYEVYAIRYATLLGFPVAQLVAGADTSRRVDGAFMVWLVRGHGRTVLVDAGFHRAPLLSRWTPGDYHTPAEAVQRLGIAPDAVTDVIITHVHWDHLDGVDLFPNATVWIQRAEYEHYVGDHGQPLERTIDSLDASLLHELRAEGRVELVDGDDREILPAITVYTGGKHTFASQYVGVRLPEGQGRVILASDNAYLYENLDRGLAIAQTLDTAMNLAAMRRMKALAGSDGHVIPGHDPAVFERYPAVAPNVVRIVP